MRGQPGFFDVDKRLRRLSDIGDQLEAYDRAVDFEVFRVDLEAALGYADGSRGGRPPFDPVLMFKILIIQAQNDLSDDRTEFLINDRLSFMRFLGLGLQDRVPDAKTIWLFRERLTRAGAIEALFVRFDAAIREAGYIAMSGQLDTSINLLFTGIREAAVRRRSKERFDERLLALSSGPSEVLSAALGTFPHHASAVLPSCQTNRMRL